MTGEPVSVHALLELTYEQFVAYTSAVASLVEILLCRIHDIGHDEPDVEFALRGVFRLDHDTLRELSC